MEVKSIEEATETAHGLVNKEHGSGFQAIVADQKTQIKEEFVIIPRNNFFDYVECYVLYGCGKLEGKLMLVRLGFLPCARLKPANAKGQVFVWRNQLVQEPPKTNKVVVFEVHQSWKWTDSTAEDVTTLELQRAVKERLDIYQFLSTKNVLSKTAPSVLTLQTAEDVRSNAISFKFGLWALTSNYFQSQLQSEQKAGVDLWIRSELAIFKKRMETCFKDNVYDLLANIRADLSDRKDFMFVQRTITQRFLIGREGDGQWKPRQTKQLPHDDAISVELKAMSGEQEWFEIDFECIPPYLFTGYNKVLVKKGKVYICIQRHMTAIAVFLYEIWLRKLYQMKSTSPLQQVQNGFQRKRPAKTTKDDERLLAMAKDWLHQIVIQTSKPSFLAFPEYKDIEELPLPACIKHMLTLYPKFEIRKRLLDFYTQVNLPHEDLLRRWKTIIDTTHIANSAKAISSLAEAERSSKAYSSKKSQMSSYGCLSTMQNGFCPLVETGVQMKPQQGQFKCSEGLSEQIRNPVHRFTLALRVPSTRVEIMITD